MHLVSSPSGSMAELLTRGPRAWTKVRLWRSLPPALRVDLAEAVLAESDPRATHILRAEIARQANYREQSLRTMKSRAVAELSNRLLTPSDTLIQIMAKSFLTGPKKSMLENYLDGLGLPHEEGTLTSDPEGLELDPARSIEVATRLLESYPSDEVIFYLLFLHIETPSLVSGLAPWLQENGRRWMGGAASAVDDPASSTSPAGAETDASVPAAPDPAGAPAVLWGAGASTPTPQRDPGAGSDFSKLDHLLIRAIVDSVQGVVGAASQDDLEAMVQEYIALNGAYHRSFFHRGFLDSLTDGSYRKTLEAENESRRGWYQAGWATGLARHNRQAEIAAMVPRLRKPPLTPGDLSPWGVHLQPLIGHALCETGRPSEALPYLSIPLLLRKPHLFRKLLKIGTDLLRQEDAEGAQTVLKHLADACQVAENRGILLPREVGIEVRRRLAHSHRLRGDAQRARELLLGLAEEELEPGLRAMVDADLGLLDGHFRALADVRLWKAERERPDILAALERGRSRFEAALASGTRHGSHGAWPLAILAMGSEDWPRASDLLSQTLAGFQEAPERYRSANLLPRVRIAAGIAVAMTMEYARLPRALDLLLQGMNDTAKIPAYLLGDVLDALALHEEPLAEQVLARVLDLDANLSLEALSASEVAQRTPAVADHLLERGRNASSPSRDRATALDMALSILLRGPNPRVEEAREALDILEELAMASRAGMVPYDVFLARLEATSELDPAWSVDDRDWARIRLLEREGRNEQALGLLHSMLARTLGGGGKTDELEAEGILERALSYGFQSELTDAMAHRLHSWQNQYGAGNLTPEAAEGASRRKQRILIVGGSETHQGLEARVQHELQQGGHNIRVEHLITGWGGNWSATLDEALRRAQGKDAVVLLRFMRTEFGRSFRSGLDSDQPWVSCPVAGTSSVARTVVKAAQWATRSG
jgi:hypothetical protein